MEDKVYVVTGGSSFIASGLLRKLVQEGKTVYAICRENSQNMYRVPEDEHIKINYCDLSELSNVSGMINEQCDVFYHLGWSTSEKNDMYLQNLNVKYTIDAVNLANNLGCHTFIGAGSQAEYGLVDVKLREDTPAFPVTGYGMAKLCAGQMSRKLCKDLGIKHIWPRIISVYGQMDNSNTLISYLVRTLEAGEVPQLTGCEQIWDFLHIDDCAEILYQLVEKGQDGEIYVVGSGEGRPLKEYVNIVRDAINKNIECNFGAKEYNADTPMYLVGNVEKIEAKHIISVTRRMGKRINSKVGEVYGMDAERQRI